MPLKTSEYRAIGWYCERYKLKPKISSAVPTMRFTDGNGKEVTRELSAIVAEYKEDKKVKAREAKYNGSELYR